MDGPKWVRLSVNGRDAHPRANKGKDDAVNFVVAKDRRDELLKGLKPDATHTADLTVSVRRGQRRAGVLWAEVDKVELRQPPAAPAADAVPAAPKRPARPRATPAVDPAAMSLRQSLAAYDPAEPDNAVGRRLAEATKGQPCLVFDGAGAVNVDASEAVVKDLKDGLPPRQTFLVKGVPHRTYKVGESPSRLFAENPLYPGSALRGDGTCDRTERTWDGVPLPVRQVVYLAVARTGELKPEKVDDAHAVLDRLAGPAAESEKWAKARFPKASVMHDELKARGELPALKLSTPQRPAEAPAVPAPPAAGPPGPPPAPTPPAPPAGKPGEKSGG